MSEQLPRTPIFIITRRRRLKFTLGSRGSSSLSVGLNERAHFHLATSLQNSKRRSEEKEPLDPRIVQVLWNFAFRQLQLARAELKEIPAQPIRDN